MGPPILKAAGNKRSYRLIRLRNGLEALLICDPDVNDVDDESTEEDNVDRTEDTNAQCESDMLLDLSNDSQYNCTGIHLSHSTCYPSFHSLRHISLQYTKAEELISAL